MILTPEQIDHNIGNWAESWNPWDKAWAVSYQHIEDVFETLAAYADIVQRVAEMDGEIDVGQAWDTLYECRFCAAEVDQDLYQEDGRLKRTNKVPHSPDCLYLAARKLRGLE